MKEKVAEWLASQVDTTNVQPVRIIINDRQWDGAVFTRNGEEMYYLVGKRPTHKSKVCYFIEIKNSKFLKPYEWYIGGYVETDQPDHKTHLFGNHWLMVPWIIEGEPDSRIDEYEPVSYKRIRVLVEEF